MKDCSSKTGYQVTAVLCIAIYMFLHQVLQRSSYRLHRKLQRTNPQNHCPRYVLTMHILSHSISQPGYGRSILDFGEQINALRKDEITLTNDGRLFLETCGRHGRMIETLHLKLRLMADIISSVYTLVRNLQRPLLNIGPESWQVKLGEVGRGLPFLWTAKAVLNNPGDAIQLTIKDTALQYYLPSPVAGTSIYRPLVSSVPTKGRASLRIRSVLSEKNDTTVVEGTFTTQERIEIASNDIVWLRIHLACGDVDLYAHLESDSAMASGEWRI